jgi:hypothetical protein
MVSFELRRPAARSWLLRTCFARADWTTFVRSVANETRRGECDQIGFRIGGRESESRTSNLASPCLDKEKEGSR